MAVTRGAAPDASELEALRADAAAARHALREAEQTNEALKRRLAAGPDPTIAEANERAEKAEERIVRLEARQRRGEVAREHGVPRELLDRVPDDELEGFACRLGEHLAAEGERLEQEQTFREATTIRRRNGVMGPISEPPDDRAMDRWIRKGFER
jgi:hypothetical protein